MLERWENILEAQPDRRFLLGLVMGRDAIDLWRFSKSGHSHTGLCELKFDQNNIGWQVRSYGLPNYVTRQSMLHSFFLILMGNCDLIL